MMNALTTTEERMDPLSEELKNFLDTAIESVAQLEVLRVLAADPAKEWTASELGRAVQASTRDVAHHVANLEAQGLLCVRRNPGFFCRYLPTTAKGEELVRGLLEAYNERPVTMIRILSKKTGREPD